MVSDEVSDQQSFVGEGSDIQQTKFQTVEWCVGGCFEQGRQYTVIDLYMGTCYVPTYP